MQEFLNPKSMLTPGVAGTLMMFLVNGIVSQFPELSPRYLGLLFSFALGGAIFVSEALAGSLIYLKGLFWILNSLIIFVVGFGSAYVAADAAGRASANADRAAVILQFIPSAAAQASKDQAVKGQDATIAKPPAASAAKAKPASVKVQLEREQDKNAVLRERVIELERAAKEVTFQQDKNQFFKRW